MTEGAHILSGIEESLGIGFLARLGCDQMLDGRLRDARRNDLPVLDAFGHGEQRVDRLLSGWRSRR